MVNRTLIRSLEDDNLEDELNAMFGDSAEEMLLDSLEDANKQFDVNQIVEGKIVEINEEFVVVDVGFKSEGAIPRNEWEEGEAPPEVGQKIKVLIEEVEDQHTNLEEVRNMISLSKRKAEKIIQWEEMMSSVSEGQVVTGTVTRKIKGGLLVDIGVNVFLPASQVDIRRPNDIADFIGRTVQCEVLKIDESRRNIVVSRRSLIEKQREQDRDHLMSELEIGQIRKGVVKNIADFGAFVDLGGIDGLLHITDMSWERIGHPSEMVSIDQEIDRIYWGADPLGVVVDHGWNRRMTLSSQGAGSVVLWNPWIAKSRRMADFGDNEYQQMVCLETANVRRAAWEVEPHGERRLMLEIACHSID